MRFHPSLFLIPVLLSACSTTVIKEEERRLPPPTAKVATEDTTPTFEADYAKSFIAFIGSKGDIISHEGKFEQFDVIIETDPENPQDSTLAKATVTIEIGSMVTDSAGLTSHLLSADFFEVETYPLAKFVTTSVIPAGEDQFDVEAELTIKNVTRLVSFPVVMTEQYLTFTYDLDRTEFGVGPPPGGVKGIDAIVPMEVKIVFL